MWVVAAEPETKRLFSRNCFKELLEVPEPGASGIVAAATGFELARPPAFVGEADSISCLLK
jgi:hypothetical protein